MRKAVPPRPPSRRITFPRLRSSLFLIVSVIPCIACAGLLYSTAIWAIFLTAAVVLFSLCAGYVYQAVSTTLDRKNYPPPGSFAFSNGHVLHYQVAGKGNPMVILEAGLSGMSSVWGWIQPEVAEFTRVLSYDRAGLGWSEPDDAPFTASRAAGQLHELLRASGIGMPFVIVGHSMGGLLARAFADRYPDEVAGVVLVDASHPDQYWRHPAIRTYMNSGFRLLRKIPVLAKFGFVRLTGFLNSQSEGLPLRQLAEAKVFLSSYRHLSTTLKESLAWETICAEVRGARDLGDKPLAVLSAGRNPLPGSLDLQRDLATLSSDSMHHIVKGATHVTLVTHREHASSVVEAIRQVVEKVKNGMWSDSE